MTLQSLDLYHVAVPLKKPIKHASHSRTSSDNLVVRVTLDDGQEGFGEGVPRPYVTGESIETTFQALSRFDFARQLGRTNSYAEVVRQLEQLTLPETAADPRGMDGNAARCAVELAILDAYGRRFGHSLSDAIHLLNLPGLPRHASPARVRYSGAITAETPSKEWSSAWKMKLYGFAQVKLKVGVSGQDDPARLERIRSILGRKVDIRLDANEAWPLEELAEHVRPMLPFAPSALEQPVAHANVGRLAEIRPQLGVPIMLDESLCGIPDAIQAIERGTADILNVRLSKCGGLVPSLRIMELAHQHGLGVQLGCHPGETGLLSAAGRHVASSVGEIRYVEGSYDRHVLTRNLINESITFRYGGWANPLTGPGLGVTVNPQALKAMTIAHKEIRYG